MWRTVRGFVDMVSKEFARNIRDGELWWRPANTSRLSRTWTWPDIQYAPYDDSCKLDVYAPDDSAANFPRKKIPVMIICHGGAFKYGSRKSMSISQFAEDVALSVGLVTVAMGYRLNEAWPAQQVDVCHAIEWVEKNIHAFGANPDEIYLCGHSAGAFLAFHGGLAPLHPATRSRIKGIIGISGIYDLDHFEKAVPGNGLLLNSLLGDPETSTVDLRQSRLNSLRLIKSEKLFAFPGKILMLVAENELPLLKADAIEVWKSPRTAKCFLQEISETDHLSIMRSKGTTLAVSEFILKK